MGWNLPDGVGQDDLDRPYNEDYGPRCPECGYPLDKCDCEFPEEPEEISIDPEGGEARSITAGMAALGKTWTGDAGKRSVRHGRRGGELHGLVERGE